MQVNIRLFALAKQKVGQSELTLELPESATVADLRQELARAYPELAPLVPNLMIAIDSEYAADEKVVEAAAEVALIPPVSGGAFPVLRRILPAATFRLQRVYTNPAGDSGADD